MSHSLRAEITHLFKKGKITRPEYDWFMKKAYGHDDVIKKVAYRQGKTEEYNRIIGLLKWNRYAIVDNNGDYYSIEELEQMLKGQDNENNV